MKPDGEPATGVFMVAAIFLETKSRIGPDEYINAAATIRGFDGSCNFVYMRHYFANILDRLFHGAVCVQAVNFIALKAKLQQHLTAMFAMLGCGAGWRFCQAINPKWAVDS
jgi:hypothetical protein